MLVYPLFVYWSIQYFEPRIVGISILLLYLLKLSFQLKHSLLRSVLVVVVMVAALVMWLANSELLLLLVPVIINIAMALIFSFYLYMPPTIPARFAKKIKGELSARDVAYTNKLSIIWIVFFIINASIALYISFYSSREIWALYNGFIAYLLMGALFAGDYLYRHLIYYRRAP